MKRVIVDYKKLTNEILSLLVEKYPDGYDAEDIIRFKNANNETIEALEVCTDEATYLVKVSTRLANTMENYDEDDDFEAEEESDSDSDTIEIPEEEEE
jgi:DNA-directed RNA polymerase subunit delta